MSRHQAHRAALVAVAVSCLVATACGPRVERGDAAPGGRGFDAEANASGGMGATPAAGAPGAGDSAGAATDAGGVGGSGAGDGAGAAAEGAAGGAGDGAGAVGPASGAPIQLGMVGTTSGLIGAQMAGQLASLQAWAAWVNDHGGVAGRPVNLNIIDDGGDPGRHAAAVRRLIDEVGVVAFVGNTAPLTFSAGASTLEAAGVPSVGGDSGERGYFTSPLSFPINGAAQPEGVALGRFAATQLPQQRLAIFHISEIEIGTRIADRVEEQWEAAGRQVVARRSVSLAHPDFTAEILLAKGESADIVALFADFSGCRRFFDAARRQDYRPVFLVASACFQPGFESANDMIAENLYVGSALEPPNSDVGDVPTMREAMARYAPSFPAARVVADGILPRGWASGRLFEAAVAAAGDRVEPAAIVEGLHTLQNETLGGLIPAQSWPAGPHPEGTCGKVLRWNGSVWQVITPDFLC